MHLFKLSSIVSLCAMAVQMNAFCGYIIKTPSGLPYAEVTTCYPERFMEIQRSEAAMVRLTYTPDVVSNAELLKGCWCSKGEWSITTRMPVISQNWQYECVYHNPYKK